MSETFKLPNGDYLTLQQDYTSREVNGVLILVIVSSISMVAVCGLLVAISLSAFNTRKSTDKQLFVRTHVAAYFVSLLLCDLLQATGSIMNEKWIRHQEVYMGHFCTVQGAIKQASDVGTAIFTVVIAVHTFFVLFLRWQMRTYVLWLTLISAWSAIATIVIAGPAALPTTTKGPFFGISGYWCWISEEYPTERITLDYMVMFLAALSSFVLYSLVFLRLRGNVVVSGWYIAFRKANKAKNASWRGRDFADNQMMGIARQMLLYPVAYTILILPIAAARFSEFGGKDVPFAATIFCDTVFLLSGTVNVILFTTTRRVLPPKSIITGRFAISRPKLVTSSMENDPEAFYRTSSMEKNLTLETPTSIFKRADSYVSDSGQFDMMEESQQTPRPMMHVPQLQSPKPLHPRGRESAGAESTYDLYQDNHPYRGSEMPRITEDEYRRSTQSPDHYDPTDMPPFQDAGFDEKYDHNGR